MVLESEIWAGGMLMASRVLLENRDAFQGCVCDLPNPVCDLPTHVQIQK